LIIGGHGSVDSITLGSHDEKGQLDLTDEKELKLLTYVMAPNSTIILDACSTGAGENSMAALFSTVFAVVPGLRVLAPSIPTAISKFHTRKGRLFVSYYRDSTHVFQIGKLKKMIPKKR
jgi:hypothetical protein